MPNTHRQKQIPSLIRESLSKVNHDEYHDEYEGRGFPGCRETSKVCGSDLNKTFLVPLLKLGGHCEKGTRSVHR